MEGSSIVVEGSGVVVVGLGVVVKAVERSVVVEVVSLCTTVLEQST